MYIHKAARIVGIGNNAHITQACLKIPYRGVEISVSFDNSCGAMTHLGRADIRVYHGESTEIDITSIIKYRHSDMICCTDIEDLIWVKRRIDRAIRLSLIPNYVEPA